MAAADRVPGILGRKIGMTQIYDERATSCR